MQGRWPERMSDRLAAALEAVTTKALLIEMIVDQARFQLADVEPGEIREEDIVWLVESWVDGARARAQLPGVSLGTRFASHGAPRFPPKPRFPPRLADLE